MSAGHSLRRQNYSFVSITPPVVSTTSEVHTRRVFLAIITAVLLDFVTFATVSMLMAGR